MKTILERLSADTLPYFKGVVKFCLALGAAAAAAKTCEWMGLYTTPVWLNTVLNDCITAGVVGTFVAKLTSSLHDKTE